MFPMHKGPAKKGVGVTVAFIGGKGESPDSYKDDKAAPEAEEEAPEEKSMDYAADTRGHAVDQLVSALGIDPKRVDRAKVEEALCAFSEATDEEETEAPRDSSASKRPSFMSR